MSYWTTFVFDGVGPNGIHCTHKYLGDLSRTQAEEVLRIIDQFFKETPFTPFSPSFDKPDLFGVNLDERVFKCKPSEIPERYADLRLNLDMFRRDDYRDYLPHVTSDESTVGRVLSSYALMEDETLIKLWTRPKKIFNSFENYRLLPASTEDERYKEEIERRIIRVFKEKVYLPLIEILDGPRNAFQNADNALQKAIASGRISFNNGVFRGKFSAAISKELKAIGATWDGSGYRLTLGRMPKSVKLAIETSEARFVKKLERIDAALEKIIPANIAGSIKTSDLFDKAIFQVEGSINDTIKNITVPAQLTDTTRLEIAKGWSNNMDKYITDFADEEIKRLRLDVATNAYAGIRRENLIQKFQDSYGVTERKARFLARQETNLLMVEYKKSRYLEAGIPDYQWQCVVGSPLHPVRPMHKDLDKTIQSWNNPPITDPDGRRNHPGQDYNCRCKARPYIQRPTEP